MSLHGLKGEATESYGLLTAVCRMEDSRLSVGYKQMRDLLERICQPIRNESLQMTDLRPVSASFRLRRAFRWRSRIACIRSG